MTRSCIVDREVSFLACVNRTFPLLLVCGKVKSSPHLVSAKEVTLSPRYQVGLWLGVILVLNWFTVSLVEPRGTVLLGYFVGSLSANATLAAAWAALGPGRLVWRLPLSIGWVFMQLICVAVNISINRGPSNGVFVIGVLLGVQWLILQLPLWGMNLGAGLQVQYGEAVSGDASTGQVRFGIRDLFILMGIVALFLGIGRVAIPYVDMSGGHEVYIFVFLGVAGVFMTLPLLVAALLQRMIVRGVVAAVFFIVMGTLAELPVFEQLGGPGPDIEDFIAINTAGAMLVLVVAGVVRLCGYSLQRSLPCARGIIRSEDFVDM